MTLKHTGIWGILPLLLMTLGAAPDLPTSAQEKKKAETYDLTWKLPHNKAAVYEVYDPARRARRGDFSLLGCEVVDGIRPNDGSDLAIRYLLWIPNCKAVTIGSQSEATGFEFSEVRSFVSPLKVVSRRALTTVKQKVFLKDVLKAANIQKGKGKGKPIEVAVINGRHVFTRLRWMDGKLVGKGKNKADAILTTRTVVRTSDGAILGGEYSWVGTRDQYELMDSDAVVRKVKEAGALLLTEPLLELKERPLKTQIDEAVSKGVRWLKSQQGRIGKISDKRGYPLGTKGGVGATALSLMALVHSGVPRDDPTIVRGFAYISKARTQQSYDLALTLMAIETKYLTLEMIRDVVEFKEEDARREIAKKISKQDKALAERVSHQLMALQGEGGAFNYVVAHKDWGNLSNTQYALLGLKSASRMGVSIPTSVWKRCLRAITKAARPTSATPVDIKSRQWNAKVENTHQAVPLGWSYWLPRQDREAGEGMVTGTMVTSALCSVAICQSELLGTAEWNKELHDLCAKAEWGALAWLQQHFGVRASWPPAAWWGSSMSSFYLYSVERAFIMSRVRVLGGHDWFLEGTAVVLSRQELDGRWEGSQGLSVVDTAFALLFLKRATIPVATETRPMIATGDKRSRKPEEPKKEDPEKN